MPYIAELEGALISLDVSGLPIVNVPPVTVLNDFGTSQQVNGYNVQDDGSPGVLNSGDYMAVETAGGTIVGEFAGGATIKNLGVTIGTPTNGGLLNSNAGIGVAVDPINGHYMVGEDGSAYFITDEPLSADRIMATLTLKLPGANAINVRVPVSGLAAKIAELDPLGLLKPVLGSVLDLTQFVLDTVIISSDFNGSSLTVSDYGIVCFARGTIIDTIHGPMKVEDLIAGVQVVTRDHGPREIKWIGAKKIKLSAGSKLAPIRIRANGLAAGVPSSDLYVSPEHRVLVRSRIARNLFGTNEVLVAAKQLLQIDGVDIASGMAEVEYFDILFEGHEIITSNGAETESLFTGPVALKSVGKAAAEEIFAIFPHLRDADYVTEPARPLISGRMGRKIVVRHCQKELALVAAH